ncbi:hypothetical protein BT96DRAFT_1004326 [Gymnopus androsaceus JB14]|uniref:Uncharacterized protein n=1 Tax=Gymnopus androsaceus JB14 TaxID=1447944 RepID=A0A6A4GRC8_9AGAR|nr:hypothetical protein BT96DRAFT_1004326 [Gymnopus androsaceus JB14]
MARVDLGDAIGSSMTRSASVEGTEDADEEDEREGAEDGNGDIDVFGIAYGVGMGGSRRSRVGPARTQRPHRENETGEFQMASLLLADAGFVGTFRRVVDHHPSQQSHPHPHLHAHAHSHPATTASTPSAGVGNGVESGFGSGMGYGHGHGHGTNFHVQYGSLAIGSTSNSGR